MQFIIYLILRDLSLSSNTVHLYANSVLINLYFLFEHLKAHLIAHEVFCYNCT